MNSYFEPYFAVIFTSKRTEGDNGYSDIAILMETLAKKQQGFIGMESAREDLGITISYWENLKSIRSWKQQSDHLFAQKKGRSDWYSWYKVRICKVEHEYDFSL